MNKQLYLIIACFVWSALAIGQEDQYDETQVVTGVRENAVKNALKISDTPALIDTTIKAQDISYQSLAKMAETEYHIDTIQAARLRLRENLEKLYKGYVKGGIGLYTTPLAEIRYNSERSRNMAYGALARHFSSNGGINDVAKNSFSDNEVDVWGRKFFRQHEGTIGARYERNMVHYYGFNPADIEYDSDDIKQVYNYMEGRANWRSYYRDSTKLNHNIDARYYHYSSAFDARENNVLITANLIRFLNTELYTLDASLDYNNYKRLTNTQLPYLAEQLGQATPQTEEVRNNAIVKLRPQIVKRGKRWHALVGIGIYADITNTAKFHFYPDIEFKYSLFDDLLIPYAGLTGRLERNSFHSLTQENPFLLSDLTLFNSSVDYELYGGFRGKFSRAVSFNVGLKYSRTRDFVFMVNDVIYSNENRFNVVYDRVDQFRVFGELTFLQHEKLLLTARGSYTGYTMREQPEAWHMPNLRLDFTGDYNLGKKLYVKFALHAENDRVALSLFDVPGAEPAGENFAVKLKGFADIDLGLEYRYTKRLSAYIEVRNLFAARYERWHNFPVQRFLLMGGFTFSF